MQLIIDTTVTYKHFDGIGASGAWWAQYVGGWDETDPLSGEPLNDTIAKLLYSAKDGIGMRTFRYNLGAGSALSGKGDYSDPARRAFALEKNGVFDETADDNAVRMIKKCVEAGAKEVVLFVNSPPERLTKNGMAHLKKHDLFRTNLSVKNYAAFADYCFDAAEHFIFDGIPVKYISPINEPLWVWNGGQEGCHYSPRQAEAVMRCFARKMRDRKTLDGVRLAGAENGDIRWFNKSYTRAVLRDPEIKERMDGVDIHSYCLHSPLPRFFNDRTGYLRRYAKWMRKHYPEADIHMSEWCHMQGGKDSGMDSALEFMKVFYEDVTILNVTSWQHWIACSMYDYCDGLIYTDLEKHSYELTKRYYATGNVSKYLPEESVRAEAGTDDDGVKALCFTNGTKTLVILINFTKDEKNLSFRQNVLVSITDSVLSLEERSVRAGETFIVPPRSVVSIMY